MARELADTLSRDSAGTTPSNFQAVLDSRKPTAYQTEIMDTEERMPQNDRPLENVDRSESKPARFRFKNKEHRADEDLEATGSESLHRRTRKRRRYDEDADSSHSYADHESNHNSSEKARKKTREDSPASDHADNIDPHTAFRESLFDALADDEGAAYWEGVYGQPIHTYPNTRQGPEGELEQMTDDEYAAYVRARMYEKTHEYIFEERECRQRAREKQKEWEEQARRMEDEHSAFQRDVERSLRRGETRRAARKWKVAWERYVAGWKSFKDGTTDTVLRNSARGVLPWPVESGRSADVSKENIEAFFFKAVPEDIPLSSALKAERVRWHPDKVQQRFGELGLDSETMKLVTAVFQVIDSLWNDEKVKTDGRR